MKLLLSYLRDKRRPFLLLLLFAGLSCTVNALYRLPWEPAAYAGALCLTAGLLAMLPDFLAYRRKHRLLEGLRQEVLSTLENLPAPGTLPEADYQALLTGLFEAKQAQAVDAARQAQEATDYFTLWAHQIKTPIAAMDLLLQSGSADAKALEAELFRIREYVDMVLCYLRLGSPATDYVFKPCDLDGIIRQALRKYAPLFIRKKLALHYEPIHKTVLTDEKWLLFVLEQVLSNALKYTPKGSITIALAGPETLSIRDTGIGIDPGDLPRIFEQGFTGQNGRSDKQATGIGLYLCRMICQRLGQSITAGSLPGQGTEVRISLKTPKIQQD